MGIGSALYTLFACTLALVLAYIFASVLRGTRQTGLGIFSFSILGVILFTLGKSSGINAPDIILFYCFIGGFLAEASVNAPVEEKKKTVSALEELNNGHLGKKIVEKYNAENEQNTKK